MSHLINHISAPLPNPELSDIENLANMTPGQVRWMKLVGCLATGRFTDAQIQPEVLGALEPGDRMYFLVSHPTNKDIEKLQVIVSRNTADTITNRDSALSGLQRLGLLREESVWQDYNNRDVVTIHSEPHQSVLFGFDTETGKRFMPDSIEDIHPGRGWSIGSATERAGLELSFALPALGTDEQSN